MILSSRESIRRMVGPDLELEFTTSGRLGTKLVFYEGVKAQAICQLQEAKAGGVSFEEQHEHLQQGDIIGIVGYPGPTVPKNKIEKGEEGEEGEEGEKELSIFATEIILLTPSTPTPRRVLWL
jgi:hypothetical protein